MNSKTYLVMIVGLASMTIASLCGAAPVNLALSGTATQSTTFCCDRGVSGAAGKAIDGNTDGDFFNGSVSHTAGDQNAFWRVDLGDTFEIGQVTVWNRTDCCADRLTNFSVSILDSSLASVSAQELFVGGGTFALSFDVLFPTNTAGRFVQIQLLGNGAILQLAEVQVFQAVPLPGALSSLCLGLAIFANCQRKHRQTI